MKISLGFGHLYFTLEEIIHFFDITKQRERSLGKLQSGKPGALPPRYFSRDDGFVWLKTKAVILKSWLGPWSVILVLITESALARMS